MAKNVKAKVQSGDQPISSKASLDRAVCQISAWLRSAGIVVIPPQPDDKYEISFITSDEDPFELYVDQREGAVRMINEWAAYIPAKELLTPSQLHEVFHMLTEKTGFGQPPIVDRGVAPTHKLNFSDDFDLIVMRHCDFRRVPNPTKETLDFYKPTALGAARHFLSTNHQFCASVGLELDDLLTYAGIWTCNFHGQYELRADRSLKCDNQKLLFRYLQQRFAEMRKTLYKRLRNVMPDYDTAATGLYDRPFTASVDFEAETAAQSAESFLDRHSDSDDDQEEEINAKVRRTKASQLLTERLAMLPHDQMVETLIGASENKHIAPDARDEAVHQLNKHRKTCPTCPKDEITLEEATESWNAVKNTDGVISISAKGLEENEEPAAVHAE